MLRRQKHALSESTTPFACTLLGHPKCLLGLHESERNLIDLTVSESYWLSLDGFATPCPL